MKVNIDGFIAALSMTQVTAQDWFDDWAFVALPYTMHCMPPDDSSFACMSVETCVHSFVMLISSLGCHVTSLRDKRTLFLLPLSDHIAIFASPRDS